MNEQEKLKMVELKRKGYPYSDIGKLFSISRQRVHQIISGYDKLRNNGWYEDLRQSIIDRDKVCQKCGASDSLIVHHIDNDDRNNFLGNLITLCTSCHGGLHGADTGGKFCQCCGESFKQKDSTITAYQNDICGKCLKEIRKLRTWHGKCEICGKDFTVPAYMVRYRQRTGRNIPRVCSNTCKGKLLTNCRLANRNGH